MVGNRAVIDFILKVEGCRPTKSYPGDAGWDLYVAQDLWIKSMETIDVPCGFDIALPNGFWGRVTSRSSTMRKHQIIVGDAVIDAGYRGPMFISVTPLRDTKIEKGWRLAQLILHRIEPVDWREVNFLLDSERGSNAYGSSGL